MVQVIIIVIKKLLKILFIYIFFLKRMTKEERDIEKKNMKNKKFNEKKKAKIRSKFFDYNNYIIL
jgi:hypothetical protein